MLSPNIRLLAPSENNEVLSRNSIVNPTLLRKLLQCGEIRVDHKRNYKVGIKVLRHGLCILKNLV